MLAYEIHVTGAHAADDAERVRAALSRACGEPVDAPLRLEEDVSVPVLALLVPAGVEWSFPRLREVLGELRAAADGGSAVTLLGEPDDDDELIEALVRQGRILLAQDRGTRARALLREAERLATRRMDEP